MYNRYIPDETGYTRILEEEAPPISAPESAQQPAPEQDQAPEKKFGGLSGLLKAIKLEKLDTGDILLLLILLFLFLEGDDIELMITLALMLLLGLD